jgi:surface protein
MQSLKKFYFGKSKLQPFISTWKTDNLSTGSSTATQVKLPLASTGSYNFEVEWGDGSQSTITSWNQPQVTKTYSVAGTYQIIIKGKCIGWQFSNTGDKLKILSIQQWGSLSLGSRIDTFFGCSNLTLSSVTDIPKINGQTLTGMFRGCTSITSINRINEWNISSVLSINTMFAGAANFNQDIGNWNVSNIQNFSFMFQSSNFNNGGSTSINNWVINTNFSVDMSAMFNQTNFFNQPIGSWNTSRVTNMANMFQSANAFNQNIGGWNVSNVTNMSGMFQSATAFNQNIGNWNVSNVTNFTNFMLGKTPAIFSAANLDAIYNGWSSRPVKTPITITFGTAKYTSASSAGRAILTGAPNNWVITDGGI